MVPSHRSLSQQAQPGQRKSHSVSAGEGGEQSKWTVLPGPPQGCAIVSLGGGKGANGPQLQPLKSPCHWAAESEYRQSSHLQRVLFLEKAL